MTETQNLSYGLREIPPVKAAWGARLIFPNGAVWDRTDMFGEQEDKDALLRWLNEFTPSIPSETFRLAVKTRTGPADEHVFTIFEDEIGIIQASAQGSHGYLYVAAWLKAHVVDDEARPYAVVEVYTEDGAAIGGNVLARLDSADAASEWIDQNTPEDRKLAGHYSIDGPEEDDESVVESVYTVTVHNHGDERALSRDEIEALLRDHVSQHTHFEAFEPIEITVEGN